MWSSDSGCYPKVPDDLNLVLICYTVFSSHAESTGLALHQRGDIHAFFSLIIVSISVTVQHFAL